MMLEDLYRLLKAGHIQAQGVVDTMSQQVVVLDRNLCVTTANNAFIRTFRVEREATLGSGFFELGDGQWDIPELRHLIAAVIPKAACCCRVRGQTRFSRDRTANLSRRRAASRAAGR